MPTQRFHVEQVNRQTASGPEDALNQLANRDDVVEVVDWGVIDAERAKQINMVIEYLEADDDAR